MKDNSERFCSHCGFKITIEDIKCPKCHKKPNPKNKKVVYFVEEQVKSTVDSKFFDALLVFLKTHAYGIALSLTIVASVVAPVIAEELETKIDKMPAMVEIIESQNQEITEIEEEPKEEEDEKKEETSKKEESKKEDTKKEEPKEEEKPVRVSNIKSVSDITNRLNSYASSGNVSGLKNMYFKNYFPDEYSKYNVSSDPGYELSSYGSVYANSPSMSESGDNETGPGNYVFLETSSLISAGYTVKEYWVSIMMCSSDSPCTDSDSNILFSVLHQALLIEKDGNWYIWKILANNERAKWMIDYNGNADAINQAVMDGVL